MLKASQILGYLKFKGIKFYSGVPCSLLSGMLKAISRDRSVRYVPAVRENAALGVASGVYLAGEKSCILIQNSGLGNIINALTSFNLIYKVPVLILVTWRGYQGKDAPEHIIMGKKTLSLLKEIGIPCRVLGGNYKRDISWALASMREASCPVALVIKDKL